MRKLLTILFCITILFIISLIISLVPISYLGSYIEKIAKKQNISLTLKSVPTLRLIGFQSSINKIEYNTTIKDNKISGRGENLLIGLLSKHIYFENLILEIHLNENETLNSAINDFLQITEKKYFSFSVKNLIINIFKQQQKEEKVIDEILLNNVEISKQKNKQDYSMDVGINKNKKASFFVTIDKPQTDNYEIISKFEDDNFSCYFYDTKRGGNINCLAQNLLLLLYDLGIEKIDDKFYKTIFNKRISLKSDISHSNSTNINGNILINKNNGSLNYNLNDKNIKINFENIDLTTTVDDLKDASLSDLEEEKQKQQIMMMSGKENKILSNAKPQATLEDMNSLHKLSLYLISFIYDIQFSTDINIKNITLEDDNNISNVIIKLKKQKQGQIIPQNVSFKFGSNQTDTLTITEDNDIYGDNLKIAGKELKNLSKILHNYNFSNLNEESYLISGNLNLLINSIFLKNITLKVNEKHILTYDNSCRFNFDDKNLYNESKIAIKDIQIDKYFNFQDIYHKLYDEFNKTQENDKQDAVFWKKLFEKRSKKNDSTKKLSFIIENSFLYNKNIDNFVLNYEDSNVNTNLNILANSDIFNGKFNFNLKNIEGKETITSLLEAKNINLNNFDSFLYDVKQSTNKEINEIFFDNKDYNIPSFVGLNGDFTIFIDNLSVQNKLFNNLKLNFKMEDGIINTDVFNFIFKKGRLDINALLSLQGRPELQIAFAGSGLDIDEIFNSPLDGFLSFQCSFKSFGFNPIKFVNYLNGSGKIVVQNLKIPKFDLLNTSKDLIINGVKKNITYKNIISKKPLFFQNGEGNLMFENGILKADISFERELVSCSAELEYDFFNKYLNKITGSFVTMVSNKPLEKPFPIYIPFACNGKINDTKCDINWQQLDDVILQYTK